MVVLGIARRNRLVKQKLIQRTYAAYNSASTEFIPVLVRFLRQSKPQQH